MQSRRLSAIESFCNVAVGYGIALTTQILVFPVFEIHVTFSSNLAISGIFTAVSLIRSYVLRRVFNRIR